MGDQMVGKVAVYTIALNEEKFCERWVKSAREADYLVVADTGSQDRTVQALQDLGVTVHTIGIRPWRFDLARNANLALVPLDAEVCFQMDMDEILMPGWRDALEDEWKPGTTRLRYHYTWNFNADGSPGVQFYADKTHHRHNYQWKHPVHEVVYPYNIEEKVVFSDRIRIEHHADNTKSRSQYLPLLKQSVMEEPNNDRNAHYYGRELMFYQQWDEAIVELKRHLSLPSATWADERSASMRFIARCYKAKSQLSEAENWFLRATAEAPHLREPVTELATMYYEQSKWSQCLAMCERALSLTNKPFSFIADAKAWGVLPYDLAAIACYRMGLFEKSVQYAQKAIEFEPTNERLQANLKFALDALSQKNNRAS
jgi:glycosyltransferase involved in cell wall biosynthesis